MLPSTPPILRLRISTISASGIDVELPATGKPIGVACTTEALGYAAVSRAGFKTKT